VIRDIYSATEPSEESRARFWMWYSIHISGGDYSSIDKMSYDIFGATELSEVSFHIYRSLFTFTGLFLYLQVSCHIYRPLFARIQDKISYDIFSATEPSEVSFHIYRSLFTFTGLLSHLQASFCTYTGQDVILHI